MNGDGKPDLVVANESNNKVVVLPNADIGNFSGQIYTVGISGPATRFLVTGTPGSVAAGTSFTVTVTAETSSTT